MSLINQALRKAQRDRTPNRMPQPGETTPAAYASTAASGMRPSVVVGLVIAVAVLIGLVVGLSMVLFMGASSRPIETTTTTPAATATSTPAPLTTTPVEPQITPPTPPQITPSPVSTAIAPTPAPEPSVVEELRKAREATEAAAQAQAEAAAAEAKAAEEVAARAAAEPSEAIIDWLGQAKISGVRISETESKVILNGKAYSVGEYVNFKLGLKVMVIQETRVLFVDNNGKKYLKRL